MVQRLGSIGACAKIWDVQVLHCRSGVVASFAGVDWPDAGPLGCAAGKSSCRSGTRTSALWLVNYYNYFTCLIKHNVLIRLFVVDQLGLATGSDDRGRETRERGSQPSGAIAA